MIGRWNPGFGTGGVLPMPTEISLMIDALFKQTIGRLRYFKTFSPDIEIIENSDLTIRETLRTELHRDGRTVGNRTFLDIGARDTARSHFADGFEYHAMDILPQSSGVVAADICCCPEVADNSFDVVFSTDVFEHLRRPWDAARECIRITKPGGLLIHRTVFAYRYHPEPVDYWRFSSQCLEYLFTHTGNTATMLKGYDLRGRRRNRRGVFLDHRPPIDWLGGFRENWQVLWIGRKQPAKGEKPCQN
jgi:SAM-dependent methyltransferase